MFKIKNLFAFGVLPFSVLCTFSEDVKARPSHSDTLEENKTKAPASKADDLGELHRVFVKKVFAQALKRDPRATYQESADSLSYEVHSNQGIRVDNELNALAKVMTMTKDLTPVQIHATLKSSLSQEAQDKLRKQRGVSVGKDGQRLDIDTGKTSPEAIKVLSTTLKGEGDAGKVTHLESSQNTICTKPQMTKFNAALKKFMIANHIPSSFSFNETFKVNEKFNLDITGKKSLSPSLSQDSTLKEEDGLADSLRDEGNSFPASLDIIDVLTSKIED